MTPNDDAPDVRTYQMIGAAKEVHHVLGCGYLERVYQLALASEFRRRQIPFAMEVDLPVPYKDEVLGCTYRVDLLCFGEVLVELKALRETSGIEEAQVLNYLKASTLEVALLLNFGTTKLGVDRISWSRGR